MGANIEVKYNRTTNDWDFGNADIKSYAFFLKPPHHSKDRFEPEGAPTSEDEPVNEWHQMEQAQSVNAKCP
jgi:hypothetical protein